MAFGAMDLWVLFPNLYSHNCLSDTDSRRLSFNMTPLNSSARGHANVGQTPRQMTESLAASLCPSSADGKGDGPGVLKGVRLRPEMGQSQSSLMSPQLQKPFVI